MENFSFNLDQLISPNVKNFDKLAIEVMKYQLKNNTVYAEYYDLVNNRLEIPYCFLPINFFKTHRIYSRYGIEEITFSSSATTGQGKSLHHVANVSLYQKSFINAFESQYGKADEYVILALLPSYLEREGSSLVYMIDWLIRESKHPLSGFYLNDFNKLAAQLKMAKVTQKKVILIGVSFALLDFAVAFPISFPELIIMETGGMKGRKKEITRSELHATLKKAFGVANIQSEYGMTEMLSQAYAIKDGLYMPAASLKVMITDTHDPFRVLPNGKTGIINVIDLANIYSCSFIQTSDIGITHSNGHFEILGRMDNSELRGCSLMHL
jgi:hypothetical protein